MAIHRGGHRDGAAAFAKFGGILGCAEGEKEFDKNYVNQTTEQN